MHLVEDLLDHREAIDATAGAGGLADHHAAVGGNLGDRIADVGHTRHGLERRIGKIAAGDLGAAFQEMAGERAGGELVPIAGLPAERVHERTERERRVGHAPGHHDVGALPERIGDRTRAEIDIGSDDLADAAQDRTIGFTRGERRGGQRAADVVAFDHRDARGFQPLLARQRKDALGRAARVGRPEIADDPDVVAKAAFEHRADETLQRRIETALPDRVCRSSCASASVRSARHSNIRKRGPSKRASASTTGPAASVRSPANPAPAPIATAEGTATIGTVPGFHAALTTAISARSSIPSAPWPHPWSCGASATS